MSDRDRIPPCDTEAEAAIIGACLTEPASKIPEAALIVTNPTFFYDERCRAVWSILIAMNPWDVNIITVADKWRLPNSIQFLGECQDKCFSTANLPAWLELVQNKYTLRQIIRIAQLAIGEAYESTEPTFLLDQFERDVLHIRPQIREHQDLKHLLQEAQRLIEYRAQNWDAITGLPTGIPDLDHMTDGLHKGEFIVVGALPSCGKTALAVNIAVHNALQNTSAGIISAEMRPVQLVVRSICSESRVNFRRISENHIPSLTVAMNRLNKSSLHIEQGSGMTIGQVTATARRLKQKAGIKLLVVDYIQKLKGVGDNREREVASISGGLKDIAMELEIPVIGLSQLNDDGKLRESRTMGQDGDSVWMLANEGAWQPEIQPVTLRIEKSRDGETGKVPLTFFKTFTRFEQASKIEEPESTVPHND